MEAPSDGLLVTFFYFTTVNSSYLNKTLYFYKTLFDWMSNESVGSPAFNFAVWMTNFVAAGSHFKNRPPGLMFHFTDNSRQLGQTCLDSWGGEGLIKKCCGGVLIKMESTTLFSAPHPFFYFAPLTINYF